jgi:phosphoenolpyruvate carboxylase
VTRETMIVNALASLDYYRQRILDLARVLSISEGSVTIPAEFRAALEAELAQVEDADRIKTRNHGEAFRQYLTCVLRKLDETILTTKGEGRGKARYANADELIRDLRILEQALIESRSPSLANDLVRPVRRAVEIFRFSTVRLDLRENTTRTNNALRDIHRIKTGKDAPDVSTRPSGRPGSSPSWRSRAMALRLPASRRSRRTRSTCSRWSRTCARGSIARPSAASSSP